MEADVPVVITGAVDDWPALEKWRDLGYSLCSMHAPFIPSVLDACPLWHFLASIDGYLPGLLLKAYIPMCSLRCSQTGGWSKNRAR
jgi:hypothetical protein